MAKIKLSSISTHPPKDINKTTTKQKTIEIIEKLDEQQNILYAEGKHSLLVILQGMDASGKDGAIHNVLGNLNPQGVEVHSFKQPTAEELSHDFLWRIHSHTPAKGMIQVFNRSHYEDILVTRVHNMIDDNMAKDRMKAINDFESLLERHNNTHILKFYLHISPEEQEIRLKERLTIGRKNWKYSPTDFQEAKLWKSYMKVYEDCFEHCNKVPWHIVPADSNWYKEYYIAKTIHETLKGLKMKYPALRV